MFGKNRNKHKKMEEGKCVRIFCGDQIIYEGKLEEIPLREHMILEKSDEFFNDPNPCFIHRGAVSVRLYAELEEALEQKNWKLWNCYADFEKITFADRC